MNDYHIEMLNLATSKEMKKIKDIPMRDRPREKLLEKGAESLSDQDIAHQLIAQFFQLSAVTFLHRQL